MRGELEGASDESDADPDDDILDPEMEQDLFELDSLNTAFVAAANDKQQEQGFATSDAAGSFHSYPDDDTVEVRPYEDEIGEHLLEELQRQGISGTSAASSNQAPEPQVRVGWIGN